MVNTIRDPGTVALSTLGAAFAIVPKLLGKMTGSSAAPQVRSLTRSDLRAALAAGIDDLAAFRSDVLFVCLLYPTIGLVIAWAAFDRDVLPLLFPLLAGFTIVGPVAAVGLYEMSRRRASGEPTSWADGFRLLSSPSLMPILAVGAILFVLFLLWIGAAALIYGATLGPEPPRGLVDLLRGTLTTPAGWAMIVVGFAVGAVFAAVALTISFVSLPLLVDRDVGLVAALTTSVKAASASPGPVAAWGVIVAVCLALAAIPALLGLIFVFPILGHATWHLYRRIVAAP
ncbi:DUF2189 domain-containing protein [Palleronia rufa]|uniref:DUF2189 domain-containing protein n=1 Tax=Palleronia rufa TaxID=1530186 RepID=UPI00056D0847|nr:DUF2189 domain-containing protein [Palleronia rufa]